MSGPSLIVLAAGRARRFGGVKPLAPIGPDHEAVIDLLTSDAVAAGFDQIVLVVNPDTGPQIREHVEAAWPKSVNVAFAFQERPLGTVHAVLAARDVVDTSLPFGVANADDLYGQAALEILATHLAAGGGNALVGFRLANALVGDDPVTRGICQVDGGVLTSISERRQVVAVDGSFRSGDGVEPAELDPSSLASMNLWGFDAAMWEVFAATMAAATDASEDAEVLLPVVAGELVSGELDAVVASAVEAARAAGIDASASKLTSFHVLPTESRCVGVTHPGDLDVVRADIIEQVNSGQRPARLFDGRD